MTVPGRSRLAATRKEAPKVFCRLPGNDVTAFAVAARDLARSGVPQSGQVVRAYVGARHPLGPVRREELPERGRGGHGRDPRRPTRPGARRALVIYNDPPYGTERSRNGLRLAHALSRRDGADVKMLLPGDAVGCAVAGQKVPDGYRHLGRMIERGAPRRGGRLLRDLHGCPVSRLPADRSRWPSAK
jgi:hypothetical protein